MSAEDLAAGPTSLQLIFLVVCTIVAGSSLGVIGTVLFSYGHPSIGLTRKSKVVAAGAAVVAAASIAAMGWLAVSTVTEVDAARQENIRTVTSWAAGYGVAVSEEQAADIASVIQGGINDTGYPVSGPEGEIALRVQEHDGVYSLAEEIDPVPLKRLDGRAEKS